MQFQFLIKFTVGAMNIFKLEIHDLHFDVNSIVNSIVIAFEKQLKNSIWTNFLRTSPRNFLTHT